MQRSTWTASVQVTPGVREGGFVLEGNPDVCCCRQARNEPWEALGSGVPQQKDLIFVLDTLCGAQSQLELWAVEMLHSWSLRTALVLNAAGVVVVSCQHQIMVGVSSRNCWTRCSANNSKIKP